jgi:hypothetical protein
MRSKGWNGLDGSGGAYAGLENASYECSRRRNPRYPFQGFGGCVLSVPWSATRLGSLSKLEESEQRFCVRVELPGVDLKTFVPQNFPVEIEVMVRVEFRLGGWGSEETGDHVPLSRPPTSTKTDVSVLFYKSFHSEHSERIPHLWHVVVLASLIREIAVPWHSWKLRCLNSLSD